jgi:hypothetical protein
MKKVSVAALLLAFIFINACTREKDEDYKPEMLGAWKLDRTVEEDYHPINTLEESNEYTGGPGDSIIFKANGLAYSYEDGSTEPEETEYKLLNDSTIRIEFETFKIRKLTSTEFNLMEDEIDHANDERWVYSIYLKR